MCLTQYDDISLAGLSSLPHLAQWRVVVVDVLTMMCARGERTENKTNTHSSSSGSSRGPMRASHNKIYVSLPETVFSFTHSLIICDMKHKFVKTWVIDCDGPFFLLLWRCFSIDEKKESSLAFQWTRLFTGRVLELSLDDVIETIKSRVSVRGRGGVETKFSSQTFSSHTIDDNLNGNWKSFSTAAERFNFPFSYNTLSMTMMTIWSLKRI